MTSGPLPPHERTWRHPSEVAAEQRAALIASPPEPGARRLALGSGVIALTLLVVALLASVATQSGVPAVELQASAPVTRAAPSVVTLPAEQIVLAREQVAASGPLANTVLATPVGDGSVALVTTASLAQDQHEAMVQLPDRSLQLAQVITTAESSDANAPGLLLVRLSTPAQPVAVASEQPSGDDFVVLTGDERVEVRLADVSTVEPPEGTSITNFRGELVGVATYVGGSGPCTIVSTDQATIDDLMLVTDPSSGPLSSATTPAPGEVWSAFGETKP